MMWLMLFFFFFSSRRRHTSCYRDWSSDVCSSDLAAGGADRARHEIGPGVDVAPRIADDGGLAGGAGRGVDANDLFLRNGEHAEGIIFPQILLGGERETGKILELAQIVGMNSRRIEFLAVRGDVFVGVAQRPLQAIEL